MPLVLYDWIEHTPTGARGNDGLETGSWEAAAASIAWYGSLSCFKKAWWWGAQVDVNAVTSSGGTALHLAGFWGLLDVAAMLLEQNADPTIKDTKGRTAWQKADDKEAFKAVLDRATKQGL